jgi:acyl dehydratase
MTERTMTRTLTITSELVREYSRRGNYHSEPTDAAALGLPGLLVQGVQVLGPAYGCLLDAWGDDFLARGELDVRFVGAVYAPDTVDALVEIDGEHATIEVTARAAGVTAVAGTARADAPA